VRDIKYLDDFDETITGICRETSNINRNMDLPLLLSSGCYNKQGRQVNFLLFSLLIVALYQTPMLISIVRGGRKKIKSQCISRSL